MLVLTRKIGEKVVVNDNIVVTLVDILDGKVRLGFDAPREIPVHRQEVYDRLHTPEAAAPAEVGSV